MAILDRFGKSIDMAALKREIAVPGLTGVRQVLSGGLIQGLTPETLAGLLRNAVWGNPEQYLMLAEEMEEKDLHYLSVLSTRKLAIEGLDIVVEAATDAAADVAAAELVREAIASVSMADAIADILDAIGKGFSITEILWDTSEKQWMPRELCWRDPRWFTFSREDGKTPLLRDNAAPLGLPLVPYKFIVHTPRIKSGIPLRGGLARAAAWGYLFKNYGVKDWVAFCEIYGQPIRVGTYHAAAQKEDIDVLITAVSNIGSDAAAVIPEGMKIEFIENAGKASSALIYEKLLDYLDKQVSKAVLGHTGSSDSTPGKLGGEDQAREVRADILRADARQLAGTINRDFVRPLVDLNLGPQKAYPRVRLHIEEPEDLTALADNLEKLVPLGMKVGASWARDKFGIPDPASDEELLTPATGALPPAPAAGGPQGGKPPAAVQARRAAQSAGNVPLPPEEQALDDLAASITPEVLQAQMEGVLKPVIDLILSGQSHEEILNTLTEAYPKMDNGPIQEMLTRAIFVSELWGQLNAR